MMMMDEILADKTMDRLSRIDKLEAILSAATQIPSEQVRVNSDSMLAKNYSFISVAGLC
jgi:exonuclease 3'-5' domain-containing protein 1